MRAICRALFYSDLMNTITELRGTDLIKAISINHKAISLSIDQSCYEFDLFHIFFCNSADKWSLYKIFMEDLLSTIF